MVSPRHLWGDTNRRDLSRQVDSLRNLHLTGLKRAFEINIANLFAQIGFRSDEPNQTVLDRQQNICPFLDLLLDLPLRLDDQFLTTVNGLAARFVFVTMIGLDATYACGGLGSRSTLLISIRSLSCSPGQSSSGDSPGILRSSLGTTSGALPLKTLKAAAGTSAALRHAATDENLISNGKATW